MGFTMGFHGVTWSSGTPAMLPIQMAMRVIGMKVPPNDFPADYYDGEFYNQDSGAPGIPGFKLNANDGHVVTPREIRAALATYDALLNTEECLDIVVGPRGAPVRVPLAVARVFIAEEYEAAWLFEHWTTWIAFLRRAEHAGFNVCRQARQ